MATTDPIHKFNTLTDRHKEVLRLVCKGTRYKVVGEELFISENTVRAHMGNIYEKLGLTHLERNQRIAIIHEIYCPLLKESPTTLVVVEDETLPRVAPEVQRMVEEDEFALMHLDSSEIIEGEVIGVSPRRRRGCVWVLIGIIVVGGLMAGLFFALGGNISGISASEPPPAATEELVSSPEIPAASDTPVVIVVTATPLPASTTPIPTNTPPPTPTDEPTSTPTTIPSPTLEPTPIGPIIETGEWYKEDDVWVRLVDYQIHFNLIYFNFEIWNKSDRALYFSWSPEQNFSMVDNKNNRYEIYALDPRNATVEKNERLIILGGTHTSLLSTVQFNKDPLYNPGVTDLFITMEYFSEIDRAVFHIIVGQ